MEQRWWGQRRVIAAAAAAVLVIIGVVAAVALSSGGGGKSPEAAASPAGNTAQGHSVDGSTNTSTKGSGGTGGPSSSTPGARGGSSDPTTGNAVGSATTVPGATTAGTIPKTTPTAPHNPGSQTTVKGTVRITTPPETAPPTITSAYTDSFRAECKKIWSHAGSDGILWDADDDSSSPHQVDECVAALDPSDSWFYDSVPEAITGGIDDADSAAEDMTIGNRFRSTSGVVFNIP